MCTSTEFMSLVSTPTISTSFGFCDLIISFCDPVKGEVDVYHFVSKHSPDHHVLFCHDPVSHFDIDVSSCMKL